MLKFIARVTGICLPLSALIICVDVVTRNIGYQLPGLGSTRLQELQWHMQGVLIAGWVGYVTLKDGHVRIDMVTRQLSRRVVRLIELVGLVLLALPYSSFLIWNGFYFVSQSYLQDESSGSMSGLPNLWIIKGVIFFGLVLLWIAVVQRIVLTFKEKTE